MSRDTRLVPGYPSAELTMTHMQDAPEGKWHFVVRRWIVPLGGTLFLLRASELFWPHWKIWHRPLVDMPADWYVVVLSLQFLLCVLVGIAGGLLGWRRSEYLPLFSNRELRESLGPESETPTLPPISRWRFLLKTTFLFALCGSLLMTTLELTSDARAASRDGLLNVSELSEMMAFRFVFFAAIGCIVAFFAWRRRTTDYWPASKDHPDTSFSKLGPM